MSTLTLAIIYLLLPRKNDGLFYALACAMAVLQIGGIIAVPDIPLTFFVALFFWCYKKFINKPSLVNSVVLGVIIALLFYSKYHSILIVGFTFLSNPSLFRKWQSYVAALTGLLLFMPHLYWQFTHGFPSVQYHLFDRNSPGYRFANTLEYIGGQILITGPLTGWLVLWAAFKYKPLDYFEKALKFSLAGFFLFFLFSTLKGRVEANWTIPAFVPLIILSHQYLLNADKLRKILIKSVPVTLVLVLAARLYMMLDVMPVKMIRKDEFHKNREWTKAIQEKAGGLPVVFINTYQLSSKYWFYTGMPSYSLNTTFYRRNNFNYWPVEDSFAGKTVYVVSGYDPVLFKDSLFTSRGLAGGGRVENFYSFSRIMIEHEGLLRVNNGTITGEIIRLSRVPVKHPGIPADLLNKNMQLFIYRNNDVITSVETNITLGAVLSGKTEFIQDHKVDVPAGVYTAVYALPSSIPEYSINSKRYKLIVE